MKRLLRWSKQLEVEEQLWQMESRWTCFQRNKGQLQKELSVDVKRGDHLDVLSESEEQKCFQAR